MTKSHKSLVFGRESSRCFDYAINLRSLTSAVGSPVPFQRPTQSHALSFPGSPTSLLLLSRLFSWALSVFSRCGAAITSAILYAAVKHRHFVTAFPHVGSDATTLHVRSVIPSFLASSFQEGTKGKSKLMNNGGDHVQNLIQYLFRHERRKDLN